MLSRCVRGTPPWRNATRRPNAGRRYATQQRAHLGELGEDQGPLARIEDLVEHLGGALELARAAGERGAVAEELGGVVAHLLEAQHGGQHQAFAADALGLVDAAQHVVHHRLVERGLLLGEGAETVHLHLLGQVRDDGAVGLEPAQNERPGERPQMGRRLLVAEPLDGDHEALPERRRRPEQARVQHLHDRPQLAEVVLDRGAGQGDPARREQRADGFGLLGLGVLHVLGLVEDDAPPRHLGQQRSCPGSPGRRW